MKKACGLTKLILSKPGVKKIAVMTNVVANTRVDIVARGVIKGGVESGRNPADTIAIFRIPGAWEDDGFKILKKYGVESGSARPGSEAPTSTSGCERMSRCLRAADGRIEPASEHFCEDAICVVVRARRGPYPAWATATDGAALGGVAWVEW